MGEEWCGRVSEFECILERESQKESDGVTERESQKESERELSQYPRCPTVYPIKLLILTHLVILCH